MAPTFVVVYNTTDAPALLDEAGHTLGGHEWGAARRGHVLDAAGNRGQVVSLTSIDREGASREALAAADLVDKWNEASRTFDGVELDALREHAAANLAHDTTVGGLSRVDLVDVLVRAGVAAPEAAAAAPQLPDDAAEASQPPAPPAPSSRRRSPGPTAEE